MPGVINTPGDPTRIFCSCADTYHYLLIPYPLPYLILLLLCPLPNLSCLVPYPFPYLTVLFLSLTLFLILLSSPLFPTLSFTYLFFSCPCPSPLPQSSLNHFPIYSFFCSSLSLTVTHTITFLLQVHQIYVTHFCMLRVSGSNTGGVVHFSFQFCY